MSSATTTSPPKPSSRATSPGPQAQQTINAALGRLSFDSEKSSGLGSPPPPAYTDSTTTHVPPSHPQVNGNGLLNGDAHGHGAVDGDGSSGSGEANGDADGERGGEGEGEVVDPIEKLQQELERTRQEREEFASQYRNLLARLNTMRSTLGNKLKQDAVRLIFANFSTSASIPLSYHSCCLLLATHLRNFFLWSRYVGVVWCGLLWCVWDMVVSCRKNSTEENKPSNP